MFLRFKYGIKIFHNILSENERILFLDTCKPLLKKISEGCPGLQTDSNLDIQFYNKKLYHLIKKIQEKSKIEGKILKCWANYTDEKLRYENWHIHLSEKRTLVYFIENPENIGTIFKVNGKQFTFKCPTNSIITFPSNIEHTVPKNILLPRYSLAMEFY